MEIKLASMTEAIALVDRLNTQQYSEAETTEMNLSFEGELAEIKLTIDGPIYHGTVPGDLARGIWEYQAAVYRAAAFAIHGVPDIRKLSPDERAKLELVFAVAEGSSALTSGVKDIVECLKGCLDGMSGTHKLIGIVMIVAILTGGYTFMHKSDNDKAVLLEKERTEQGRTIKDAAVGAVKANTIAEKFSEANETGLIAIAKAASDATSIRLGTTCLDQAAIRDINRKSDRTKPVPELVDGPFVIFELNVKEANKTIGILCDKYGREFSLTLDHEEFPTPALEKMWNAAKSRSPINLDVTMTIAADGSVRKAQLITIY